VSKSKRQTSQNLAPGMRGVAHTGHGAPPAAAARVAAGIAVDGLIWLGAPSSFVPHSEQ
jgi:hypothetical protein